MALTLAITKIGDLLLQQRITKGMDGKPITPLALKIPDYQRPYAWEFKECQQLWEDIFSFAFPDDDYEKFNNDDEYSQYVKARIPEIEADLTPKK